MGYFCSRVHGEVLLKRMDLVPSTDNESKRSKIQCVTFHELEERDYVTATTPWLQAERFVTVHWHPSVGRTG